MTSPYTWKSSLNMLGYLYNMIYRGRLAQEKTLGVSVHGMCRCNCVQRRKRSRLRSSGLSNYLPDFWHISAIPFNWTLLNWTLRCTKTFWMLFITPLEWQQFYMSAGLNYIFYGYLYSPLYKKIGNLRMSTSYKTRYK